MVWCLPFRIRDLGDICGGEGVVHQVTGRRILSRLPSRLGFHQRNQFTANLRGKKTNPYLKLISFLARYLSDILVHCYWCPCVLDLSWLWFLPCPSSCPRPLRALPQIDACVDPRNRTNPGKTSRQNYDLKNQRPLSWSARYRLTVCKKCQFSFRVMFDWHVL